MTVDAQVTVHVHNRLHQKNQQVAEIENQPDLQNELNRAFGKESSQVEAGDDGQAGSSGRDGRIGDYGCFCGRKVVVNRPPFVAKQKVTRHTAHNETCCHRNKWPKVWAPAGFAAGCSFARDAIQ